ncbi:restriction endonuclease subunit S [Helicobacter cappadocius]|uniref:Restriction endonuclease subunit S n=1 Tax=Helicobacter cappadocius TaxID=3063998 RepID=A0ABT8Z620_9HELI|nr:restriction endonuclease subunit S [Helicobacter sp. faydin-H75]MDO7253961.1 restriction endonuclease subunit S [Helicobacter sp. faydin-H75]
MVSGGAQKNLNAQIISNFKIPIPPLEEQERIVGILDKFDELVSDISLGIPAEIQMRKKQYLLIKTGFYEFYFFII